MKIYTPGGEVPPLRVCIYGDPKIGKTRLATSLPWGHPRFGDKAVYVAWDPGAEDMASVLVENRKHLVTVKQMPKVIVEKGKERIVFDPLMEATEIASRNWLKEGVQTIIWDTMSTTSRDLLTAITAQGLHGKRPEYGDPNTDAFVPQPVPGDYGAAQRSVMFILDFLFKQPINVIVLFHADSDDNDGKGDLVGGPSTVGRAAIKPIASLFDNLFRVAYDKKRVGAGIPPQYDIRRVVQTESKSYWMTGIRSPHATNPMPEFVMGENCADFWVRLDKIMKGE